MEVTHPAVFTRARMWRGFGVRPIKGHCAKFLHHLKVNVCQRNKQYYRYLIAWLAQMVQHPGEKIGTSVVLRGPSGVGKTTVGVYVGSMFFVDNYAPVSSSERITGKFNAHLKTAILLVADEAFWAGDKAAEGRLKDLITSDRQFIEFKGKEVVPIGNYIRVLVFGNPDWLVPATLSERRWVVWDMGTEHKQKFEYFAAFYDEMKNGGSEALLYHLLNNVDLSKIELREIPKTAALLDQKVATMTIEQSWWYDVLSRGILPHGYSGSARSCPSLHLFNRYQKKAGQQGARRKALETQLGVFLRKCVPGLMKARRTYEDEEAKTDVRGWVYFFPQLKECRTAFERELQQPVDWDDPDMDWKIEPKPIPF
jgi:hypothetical protein